MLLYSHTRAAISLLPRTCLASPGMASIDTTVTSTPRLKLDEDALLRYLRAVGTKRNSPHNRFDEQKEAPLSTSNKDAARAPHVSLCSAPVEAQAPHPTLATRRQRACRSARARRALVCCLLTPIGV